MSNHTNVILDKIISNIGDKNRFEQGLINHIEKNKYNVIIYQSLYKRFIPKQRNFSTNEFKKLLIKKDYLNFINTTYRTRVSEERMNNIAKKLKKINDFNDYTNVLKVFQKNNRKTKEKNAFSFGTKVLHWYNPEKNPMLDSVVRDNLKIKYKYNMDINLCIDYKKAMNRFAKKYKEHFSVIQSKSMLELLNIYDITPNFPKMKLLDMALYQKPDNK